MTLLQIRPCELEPPSGYFESLEKCRKPIFLNWTNSEYLLRGFSFGVESVIGLHPLVSGHVRASVEGKRITLTQGERVPECATTRDKQVNSIDDEILRGDSLTYLINKVVASITNRYSFRTEDRHGIYHHLYRSPCIV